VAAEPSKPRLLCSVCCARASGRCDPGSGRRGGSRHAPSFFARSVRLWARGAQLWLVGRAGLAPTARPHAPPLPEAGTVTVAALAALLGPARAARWPSAPTRRHPGGRPRDRQPAIGDGEVPGPRVCDHARGVEAGTVGGPAPRRTDGSRWSTHSGDRRCRCGRAWGGSTGGD
jgi:hypothetical protein